MLTTREVHLSTSSPYFYAATPSGEHHYENIDADSFGFHSSCSFYQSRESYHPLRPNILDTDFTISCCSSSSCSSSKSSPSSERHFAHRSHAAAGIHITTEKMTDCDCHESAAISQDEGHQLRLLDSVADMVHHNGQINEPSIHSQDVAWALTSTRDGVQLRVEPRNGFVCFIGLDAASCELVLRSSQGDTTIDGRQAVLVYANGAFHLKDLNSSYGTYINERRVPSRCFLQLKEHDQVRFGFSTDVYHLQQITTSSSSASSVDESVLMKARNSELDPNAVTSTAKQSGPMNKLLRLKKTRKSDKTKSKEDVANGKSSASATSKLSPSTSSLMSSASSNSSSSSANSPSSVFMSAMKMMKNRFKRKSSKDKSMVCSGNDDITFIRYDSHSDVASAQSASAPQSPSQPLSRMFRSHTYLDSYSERDLSPIMSAQSTCGRTKGNEFGQTLVEHDYDEVAREDDSSICAAVPLSLNLQQLAAPETENQEELNEADLENGATSTSDSVVRESENEDDDEDSFDDILETNEEEIYGHVDAYNEFESCTPGQDFTDDLRPDSESLEPHKDSSTCSSVVVLPHLNSEDRLNNNSSLDTLLTQSILVKSNCPLDYLEDSVEPDFHLLLSTSFDVVEDDDISEKESRPLEEVDSAPIQSPTSTTKAKEASLMKERSGAGVGGPVCATSSYGNVDGNYHRTTLFSPEHESTLLRLSATCATLPVETSNTCDLESSSLQPANGSWSEEESPKETSECEYDIDDIGHLRRHPTAAPASCASANEQMTASQSRNSLEIYWPYRQQATLSLQDGNVSSESDEKSGQSRRAIGGMAFVINFDQNSTSTGQSNGIPAALIAGQRRLHPKVADKQSSTLVKDEPAYLARQGSCRRSRNATATLPSITKANRTDEVNIESDGTTVKSPSRNRDNLEDRNTRFCVAKAVREPVIAPTSSFAATNQSALQLTGQATVCSNGREDTVTCSSGTMKKNKMPSSPADPRDATSGTRRSSTRSGQLSESAVYLINRMFEDSDYHRYCADTNEQYESHYGDEHLYPSISHQSMSSSRSASPYSTNNQKLHTSSPYICNSSTASTRMEYDESLSSLHSNSDSAQRLSRLQSLTTVVQSQSSHSTLEKQVDSAIDDDADLIADDISETGTYTVEIDDGGSKHRRKTCSETTEKMDKPTNDQNIDEDSAVAEPVANTDYEADADCEVEDNEEEEEEDQLEIARRKIDELFHVYSIQNSNECLQPDTVSGYSTVNNSTFTRSKRRPQAIMSTDEDETAATTSATSDECLPISAQYRDAKEKNFSKKRISTELMTALKKINSKLEKTAKLGKIALDEPKSKVKPSAVPLRQLKQPSSPAYTVPKPSKTHSAPATPLLSENRKSFRYSKPTPVPTGARVTSRKNSTTTLASSVDDFDDQSSAVSADTFVRGRSESVNSNASNNSSLRFNRAFALRRARLGMDTCGVEISEQAANKAKEAQAKATPKPKQQPPSFRRNDGGRFSLRVSSAPTGARTRQPLPASSLSKQPLVVKTAATAATPLKPKTANQPSSAKSTPVKIRTSYSASASVCSSSENLSASKVACPSPRFLRKHSRPSTVATPPILKVAHSDNEIVHDGESSCGEETQLFTRFGRSSLRHPSTSSTPWLQSLKANREAGNISKQRQAVSTPAQPSSVFNSTLQKSSSFSSNAAAKNYSSRSTHSYGIPEAYDKHSDGAPTECVRSIPSFQMGKRFFSTKPHQRAQFDREFNSVTRCSSAAAANGNNSKKLPPDPNLMTHSATESLLSRHVVSTSPGTTAADLSSVRAEPITPASANVTPPINGSGINARIFSISPLDSLVISAINQLSSKLRTRMRDLLERERSNHSLGTETRVLIEEILPQVGPSAIGMDSRSGQSKNSYSHEPSNISRDLSNVLKNLKKVEQIFEVFNMLLESGMNCQEVSSDQVSMVSGNNCNAIVTHASDSDTSDGQVAAISSAAFAISPQVSKSSAHRQPVPLNRYASHSPPSPSSPPNTRTGGGFFIEI